ncbi:MAG: hypothetical protein IJZ29_04465 [Clostridia bacterium]|nr:hypothetical protein [Clostridia bacterium]
MFYSVEKKQDFDKTRFLKVCKSLNFDNVFNDSCDFEIVGKSLVVVSESGFAFVFPFPVTLNVEEISNNVYFENSKLNVNKTFSALCWNNNFQIFNNSKLVATICNRNNNQCANTCKFSTLKSEVSLNDGKLFIKTYTQLLGQSNCSKCGTYTKLVNLNDNVCVDVKDFNSRLENEYTLEKE